MPGFTIREVDGCDEEDTLHALHDVTFGKHAPHPDYTEGYWWLVFDGDYPVAFACISQSSMGPEYGYLKRAGVIPSHRGLGLQRRLIRCRMAKARRVGWTTVLTDTTRNVGSANSLIKAGFRLFTPKPWAWSYSLYWYKRT